MGIPANPNIEKARELFENGMKLNEIAELVGVAEGTVRSWKCRNKWKCNVAKGKRNVAKKKPAKNGSGKPRGAPLGNKNAEKYGLFSKWLPEETMEIINESEGLNPINLLLDNIQLQYAALQIGRAHV